MGLGLSSYDKFDDCRSETSECIQKVVVETPKRKKRKESRLYLLVDMHGCGDLVPWMRYADFTGDHSVIDSYISVKVPLFLNNKGKGKLFRVAELVKRRNKERNQFVDSPSRLEGADMIEPNILDEFDQECENAGDIYKGSMGETLVGVCLLNDSPTHTKLAIKLCEHFPALINDIMLSVDYYDDFHPSSDQIISLTHHLSQRHYGLRSLSSASGTPQDIPLVVWLLRHGADPNQRCYGAYFSPYDQMMDRTDSLEHEYVTLDTENTDYKGSMYFGEYPHSFAACLNDSDSFQKLMSYRANSSAQDTNGNTVLHMCVIHDKLEMLLMAIEFGGSVWLKNKQGLTALSLAARMARTKIFNELLYCLSDTKGVYGESREDQPEHLSLFDGLLEQLLEAKWKTFAKRKMFRSLGFFVAYYFCFFNAFMMRPISNVTEMQTKGAIDGSGKYIGNATEYDESRTRCHLLLYSETHRGFVRHGFEVAVILFIVDKLFLDIRLLCEIGWKKWTKVYEAFPDKAIFKISWILLLCCIPFRIFCTAHQKMFDIENCLVLCAVIMTSLHFFFYCRAIPFLSTFVVMIHSIISRDLRQFLMIYIVFLMAFYMAFLACEQSVRNGDLQGVTWRNIMSTPWDAFTRTFLIGKLFILLYKLLGSVLFLNLFIAMMRRTFSTISEHTEEHKRQWARVILMVEMSLKPADRLRHLIKYSQPTGTNKRCRSFAVMKNVDFAKMSEHEKDMEELHQMQKKYEQKKTELEKKYANKPPPRKTRMIQRSGMKP